MYVWVQKICLIWWGRRQLAAGNVAGAAEAAGRGLTAAQRSEDRSLEAQATAALGEMYRCGIRLLRALTL